jgi:hypothetical protein
MSEPLDVSGDIPHNKSLMSERTGGQVPEVPV